MKKHCMNCSQYFDGMMSLASNPSISSETFADCESFNPICLFGLTLGTTMGPFFRVSGEDTQCPFWQHEVKVLTK